MQELRAALNELKNSPLDIPINHHISALETFSRTWHFLSKQQVDFIQKTFEKFEPQFLLDQYPLLMPDTALLPDALRDTFDFYRFWLSKDYFQLNEPSLIEWAEQNGVVEAYRFLYMPSFIKPTLIRVWRTETINCIVKHPVEASPNNDYFEEHMIRLEHKDWTKWVTVLARTKFWSPTPWPEDREEADGIGYVCEGFQEGRYMFKKASNPRSGPSLRLAKLFFSFIRN